MTGQAPRSNAKRGAGRKSCPSGGEFSLECGYLPEPVKNVPRSASIIAVKGEAAGWFEGAADFPAGAACAGAWAVGVGAGVTAAGGEAVGVVWIAGCGWRAFWAVFASTNGWQA